MYLAKEKGTDTMYAAKILEKKHILKEKKEKYVMTEREVRTLLADDWRVAGRRPGRSRITHRASRRSSTC